MYDVAIIGAGPAGATLARLVPPSLRVLLVERRDSGTDHRPTDKCCGGLLAPDAQRVLAEMGLGLPESVTVGPQLFAVRCLDLPAGLERFYQRHYINFDRGRFDRWLLSTVPPEVELRQGAMLKSIQVDPDGVRIGLSINGRTCRERASLVVGADGAGSMVRRHCFPAVPSPQRYAAIQEWFDLPNPPACFGSIFDPRVTDFYSWTIPKGRHLIVGSAIPAGRSARRRFELLKRALGRTGLTLGNPVHRQGTLIERPRRSGHICTGSGRVVLVGEAAGWISPSSAEGISYAFRSALLLCEALRAGPEEAADRYARAAQPLKRNILLKNAKCPAMYFGPLRRAILRTGFRAMAISPASALPGPAV